jgi:hypothetical protein
MSDYPKFPEARRLGLIPEPTPTLELDSIEHEAEALQYAAKYAALFPDFEYPDYAALMQMHATLYLAEQQRVANLIAFEVISGEKNRAEIRKGLSL